VSDETEAQEAMPETAPAAGYGFPQTQDARALSKISLVVVEGGRQAWANFEYQDSALPDETPLELQDRVNEVALNGALDAAQAAREAQQHIIHQEKAAKESKA